MDRIIQTNICTIHSVIEILLDKYTEIFHPCWRVDLRRDFPKTSKKFKKNEQCGYHTATFKGLNGLKDYIIYHGFFNEEYAKLSRLQQFLMYFATSPFVKNDIPVFAKKLDLNKSIGDVMDNAIRISAKEIGTNPKNVFEYIERSCSNRDTYDDIKKLMGKARALSCLI